MLMLRKDTLDLPFCPPVLCLATLYPVLLLTRRSRNPLRIRTPSADDHAWIPYRVLKFCVVLTGQPEEKHKLLLFSGMQWMDIHSAWAKTTLTQ